MGITVTLIGDKIEMFVEIFSDTKYSSVKASRIRFQEIYEDGKYLYKQDEIGDGLLTMTIEQAKRLKEQLEKILLKEKP